MKEIGVASVVPDYVIDRQLRSFEIPFKKEGWDLIRVVDSDAKTIEGEWKKYHELVKNFGAQENIHHSYSLQDHCQVCCKIAMRNRYSIDIIAAASIHDFGKALTKTYWEKDNYQNAHYPNHAQVGGYLAMNMGYTLEEAQLVCYHMIPYADKRTQDVWRERLGQELWEKIELLHEVDELAHQECLYGIFYNFHYMFYSLLYAST